MKRTTFLSAAGASAAACVLPAKRALAQSFQQQLTIGVMAPFSGPLSDAGSQIMGGVRAAIDETNMRVGTFGTTFMARAFDDIDALAQTLQNVQFASGDPTVLAIIGGLDGKLTAAALPTYAAAQLPLLVSASTADVVTARGFRNVWRLPAKDSIEGRLFARFIARRGKPKYAMAVTTDGDYGPDVAAGFVEQMSALGVKAETLTLSWQKPAYATTAQTLAARKPDYIYLAGETKTLGPLTAALKSAGYIGSFGASEGFYNQAALDTYSAALNGAMVSTSFPPLDRAPDVANVLNDFKVRAPVTALSAFSYAAAQIVISASQRNGATNRLAMMSALQTPIAYDTIAGSFQFGIDGDPIDPNVYFYAVNGGSFKYTAAAHPTAFIL